MTHIVTCSKGHKHQATVVGNTVYIEHVGTCYVVQTARIR